MKKFFILSLSLSLILPTLGFAVELSAEEKSSQLSSIIESIKNLINSLRKDQAAAAIVISQNTFAAKINAELDALVNGPGKGNFYIYENNSNTLGGALKPNSTSWSYPLDFTGVSTWQSEWSDARKTGTLIAPQYMIQAAHYVYPIGKKVRFADKNGVVEERTTVDSRVISGSDIQITKLDAPLPTDRFKVYRVLASVDEFNQKNSFDEIPIINDKLIGETKNLKFLTLNQDRSVIIQQGIGESGNDQIDIWEMAVSGCPVQFGSYLNPNFSAIRDGDSGSPGFVAINGELILMETHKGSIFCMSGPFISKYVSTINSVISEMGGTDRVSTVSLSSLGSFENVNHAPQFIKKNYRYQIVEKSTVGTVLGKIEARDIDAGQSLTYSIVGGTGVNYFAINPTTGQITVKDSLGLDFNSSTIRSLAGITSGNTIAIPTLYLDIKVTDNGNPNKSNSIVKSVGSVSYPVEIEVLKSSSAVNAKTIAIVSPITRTQISASTPLNFTYQIRNWPTSSVVVSLIPYNSEGIEIRGGTYPLENGSLINMPVINSLRSGSEFYTEEISQTTINLYESRARILGSLMSGGLKLPIKYKVKICGSGTDSSLCAISNESFTFLNPVVSTPNPNPDPVPDPEENPLPENVAPVLQTIGTKTVAENNQLTFTLSATDANSGDVLTYSATNLPSGATFNANTQVFTFYPSFTQSGSYSPTFTVSDGKGGSDFETVSIFVTNTNRAPVVSTGADQVITTLSTSLSGAGSSDPDGSSVSFSWSKVSGPGNVIFSNPTSSATNATFSVAGPYSIRLTVSDGTISASKEVSIAVTTPVISRKNIDTDGDGKNDELDYCAGTPSELKSSVNIFGCIKPLVSNFDIRPSLDRNLNVVKSLELGKSGLGKISFTDEISLARTSEALDIDSNLEFSPKKVVLNSSEIPELNKPATITLYNLTETTPKILKDGAECKSPQCVINSYSNGTLVFTVTGFSTYEIAEGAVNTSSSKNGGGTKSKTTTSSVSLPTNATREQLIAYLTAKIQELIAEYTRVKALEDAQGGSVSNENVLKGFQFTKTFGLNTTDKEVRYLQRFLNTHGFPVGTGLGSYGKEVDTFGPVTQSTLMKYQTAQGIEATGYFGQVTKARVNQTIAGE